MGLVLLLASFASLASFGVGCGDDKAPAKARAQPTVEDCKAQIANHAECAGEAYAKKPEGLAPAELAAKIAAITDLQSCTQLLGELQKSGEPSCWPR